MDRKNRKRRNLNNIIVFICCFGFVAGIVTSCILMFLWGANLPSEDIIRTNAKKVLFNVIFIGFLLTLIGYIYKKVFIERPIVRILEITDKIKGGDFSARAKNYKNLDVLYDFNMIIDNINLMAQELSGVETLRTDFIANVSHELKTPLAVIQNYSTMLQLPDLTDEMRLEYAKKITDSSKKLTALITNILKLNKLENQQILPESTVFNLTEQICKSMLEFEDIWEEKEIGISTDFDDITVKSDAQLLSIVWHNLFSNAVKFTDKGGKIYVSIKKENNKAVVTVKDTGCGIPKNVKGHIFEKFYQGDTSHSSEGNGLGLALVKRIMDLTGNEIEAESEEGFGSTFTVRI